MPAPTKQYQRSLSRLQSIASLIILFFYDVVDCLRMPEGARRRKGSTLNATGNVHLLSLRWPSETTSFSKPVKDLWRWKDSVLGDGRDFFVPKPKTLTALNRHFVHNCESVVECSVLSNCARFELLVCSPENIDSGVVRDQISQILANQVQGHQGRPYSWMLDQVGRLDSAKSIDINASQCNEGIVINDIRAHWNCLSGVEVVCRHLCLVAAGMATRPNRPEKAVPFRPFSSRDAHIMLQLKRTPTEGSRVKLLMDAALAAGKMARDPKKVPELESLRRFGSGDSKYSMDPPQLVTDAAARAAVSRAIDPTVVQYVERWNAMETADTIALLRRTTEQLSQTDAELQWVRKELHKPTMDLRQGRDVNIEAIFEELNEKLTMQRQLGLLNASPRGRLS